ncbi:hypothetical protein GW17_00025710 [Ensete ventricosum]|nr:hypothetical protein GW17_00025710 [Ensete ventricosum]RZS20120.1 hypothetical protein BHM03_00052591 [Ensete ventricosum]
MSGTHLSRGRRYNPHAAPAAERLPQALLLNKHTQQEPEISHLILGLTLSGEDRIGRRATWTARPPRRPPRLQVPPAEVSRRPFLVRLLYKKKREEPSRFSCGSLFLQH